MSLDATAVRKACAGAEISTHRHLCGTEAERFRAALQDGTAVTVGCTQEAPRFSELAGERDAPLDFVNVRETAGWSTEGAQAGPKMAALFAAAAEPAPDFPLVSLSSEGVILVYGRDENAIEAGKLLADQLDVTVLLSKPGQLTPPSVTVFPVVKGTIRNAAGHLGAFELTVDDYAHPRPSSRDMLVFEPARDGAIARAVAVGLPSVTMVRTGDLIGQVGDLLGQIALAIRAAAAVTVAAGIVVLVGAVAASGRARRYDVLILKLLGGNRRQLLGGQALEYALLSALLIAVAVAVGGGGGWYVVVKVFALPFAPDWAVVAGTLAAAIAMTLGIGVLGSLPALAARPAQGLREM